MCTLLNVSTGITVTESLLAFEISFLIIGTNDRSTCTCSKNCSQCPNYTGVPINLKMHLVSHMLQQAALKLSDPSKLNVIIWSVYYHLGWNVIMCDLMLSSGANGITWSKCYHLCYHVMLLCGIKLLLLLFIEPQACQTSPAYEGLKNFFKIIFFYIKTNYIQNKSRSRQARGWRV